MHQIKICWCCNIFKDVYLPFSLSPDILLGALCSALCEAHLHIFELKGRHPQPV